MIPNSIRKTIHVVFERIFGIWWDWYYKFFNHAPRHYYEEEGDDWILEHWKENPHDPICFPLPLRINCLGCTGCKTVSNPPFGQDKPKGPYKVFFHPLFLNQYEGMFGKLATFELVNNMRQRNDEVDFIHLTEDNKETERDIKFPKGQPRYWYAEYDVEDKVLKIRLGKFIIELPQELILSWFMCQEYNTRISEEP